MIASELDFLFLRKKFRNIFPYFKTLWLQEDIQVKEGEALRQTLHMMVLELPQEIKGKTLVCKVYNQSLKAVMERKGSTKVLALNSIGKEIYWLQQWGILH